jgi:hypothetical protein
MSNPIYRITLPPRLRAAAERAAAAAGVSLAVWIRGLMESATGVSEPLLQGAAALSPRARKAFARQGRAARTAKTISEKPEK